MINGRDWDHFLRAINTSFAVETLDGFPAFYSLLFAAARAPLRRDDDRRWLAAENEGPGEWVMSYTRQMNLKTPLQSVMEWEGKRSIAEIINTYLRFQKTTLQGNNNSSQMTVTIYFA